MLNSLLAVVGDGGGKLRIICLYELQASVRKISLFVC